MNKQLLKSQINEYYKKVREQSNARLVAVQKHIDWLGLTESQLGLKTKEDKILYYINNLDKTNKFVGRIEFHNTFFAELLNFLCDTDEKIKTYFLQFHDQDNLIDGILRFRKYILSQRQCTIDTNTLQELLNNQDWQSFWQSMQQLYLDVYDYSYLGNIIDRISQGLTIHDIYEWFEKKQGRLLTILNFKNDYIKSSVC